jgi:ABC-type nitrate/sulfonate/bicarbonate transport system substrate-binding protein
MSARKNSGIKTPADLKGKRVGTIKGTSAHYFAYMYLLEHKIDPATVTISFYPSAEIPEALKNGQVDAIVAFEPYAYLSEMAMPGQTIALPKSALFRETFNLVAMKSWTGQHPEIVKKMLRAVDKAITFAQQNKQESIGILIKNAKFSKEMLEAVWDDYIFQLTLDNSMLSTLEDEARWAIQNKLVDQQKMPNYLDFYYLDAMKAVKPGAVSIVK